MRKTIILLAIGCLLVVLAGCNGHKNTAASVPVKQPTTTKNYAVIPAPATAQPSVSSKADGAGSSSLYDQSLLFPDGKVITSDIGQIGYGWKGLGIQLCTMWAYPGNDNTSLARLLGNHVAIISQRPVTLSIGPAVLVLADRTPPAASGDNTVTHECWLIVFHPDPEHTDRQIAYTMQARCSGVTPGDAAAEILELAKGWKIPALQAQGPGK
jgi:hypothetical protein